MAEAAREAGAEIRTGADVRAILVKDGAAAGVVLADGTEIARRPRSSPAPTRATRCSRSSIPSSSIPAS